MGKIYGETTTAATTEAACSSCTYLQPAGVLLNTRRSIVSTSADDSNSGSGAQVVRITYYVQSISGGGLQGPFFLDRVLTGTTPGDISSTAITYIEEIRVLSGGAGGTYPAGTVKLFPLPGGAGTPICQINPGERQTFLGHHYIATGKTATINSLFFSNQATEDRVARFRMRTLDMTDPSSVERVLGVDYYAPGITPLTSQAAFTGSFYIGFRNLNVTNLKIAGPARLRVYVQPASATSQISQCELDVSDA